MKSVLVISHQQGFESDPVIDELQKRGIPYFRYNQDDEEVVSTASVDILSDSVVFGCDGKKISWLNIGVAWFQQPPPFAGQPRNEVQCLQQESIDAINRGVFAQLGCPWFNHFESVAHACNKVVQLRRAKLLDLPVMPTLISNNPEEIRQFCEGGPTIAKNLATPWIARGDETTAAYAKLVQPSWLLNDEELRFAPVIYQRYCRRVKDYRVVAINGHHFCVSCVPSEGQMEDVRRSDHTGEGYDTCTLPSELLWRLQLLMKCMDIDYCSADFMEDVDGNIFFLEANICGAWWWVDQYYNGDICQCLTDQIVRKM